MSWTTGTQTEALAVANANGSQLSNVSTVTIVSPATGAGYCPANFWLPSYGQSKSLYLKAFGVTSTTGTPSITVAVAGDTTQGTWVAGNVLATTGSVAFSASGLSNAPWELDLLITNVTTGSSGTFIADGNVKVYTTTTTIQNFRISSSAANPNTSATLSTQSAYYIETAVTFSAASASNTFQVYSYAVLGLN